MRLFFASQTEVEQTHIVAALVFELSKVKLAHVRVRVLGQLQNVHVGLAKRVAAGLGAELPGAVSPAKAPIDMAVSDALSILKQTTPVAGRCLGLLVADGTDGTVVAALQAAAQSAGVTVNIIAPKVGGVTLRDGTHLAADEKIDGAPSVLFDGIALVLSGDGASLLTGEKAAVDFVSDAYAHCKAIGHTPGAKALIDKAGVATDAFFALLPKDASALISIMPLRASEREKIVKLPV